MARARRTRDDAEDTAAIRAEERTGGEDEVLPPAPRRHGTVEQLEEVKAALPSGFTNAPANGGVTGTRFFGRSPDVSEGTLSDASTIPFAPIGRPETTQGAGATPYATPTKAPTPQAATRANVTVFGLQTAKGVRPSAFAPVRHHASQQHHWPRARDEVSQPVARPASSSLNDWDARPAVSGDAARELALRLGAMKL